MVNSSGSTWKRWEPHTHTPETALNDQFNVPWEDYIAMLESLEPSIVGIGVTDYFTTEGYRKVRDYQRLGRLPGVFLFPNIEMRLALGTTDGDGVNVHLLVSPEDPDHLEKINGKLALLPHRFGTEEYNCTPDSLRHLGRAWHAHANQKTLAESRAEVDPVGALRLGANQFKVEFSTLCGWRDKDPWLKANTLIAVPNGHDGAGGLPRGNDTAFASIRETLRRAAHVMLTSNPADRAYWLGHGTDDEQELVRKYGGRKPCLHGSDAHDLKRLTEPGDRFCWIKAEPTWRGFLQIIAEPEDRLFIGPMPPDPPRTSWIKSISVEGDPWCPATSIDLNAGLVAIIGSRGSGKTALADLIAYGAGAYEPGPASFLGKARKFVKGATVALTWGDDRIDKAEVDPDDLGTAAPGQEDEDWPVASDATYGRALYLSQHFVEALCAPDGRRDRLGDEIERVIFERLEPDERLGTSTFPELRHRETEALHGAKDALEEEVRRRSKLVAEEHAAQQRLPDMKKRLGALADEMKRLDEALKRVAPPKAQEKQAAFARAQKEVEKREDELKALALRIKTIEDLKVELETAATDARRRTEEFAARVRAAFPDLPEEKVRAFSLSFTGDYNEVLGTGLAKLREESAKLRGPAEAPYPEGSYMDLKTKFNAAQKALRDAGVIEKNLANLMKTRASKQKEHETLAKQVEHTSGARERIRTHQEERLASYARIIAQLGQEEEILRRLYRPLERELGGMKLSESRLTLHVGRRADVEAWVRRGEQLFDMRKSHLVTKPGELLALANEHLLDAWEGSADPSTAIASVLAKLDDISKLQACFATDVTLETFAAWLFSTEHIRVDYEIVYDGVNIADLSPGTRGVVLLIIYLRLDTTDDRPLVIDQPEENLDPKSVFADLVRFFKEARRRRQIIMVTHNANLVVNADADQVLIADGVRGKVPGPPVLTYRVGVLEDKASQDEVCAILEGGAEAFRQRDRRYKIAMQVQFE